MELKREIIMRIVNRQVQQLGEGYQLLNMSLAKYLRLLRSLMINVC